MKSEYPTEAKLDSLREQGIVPVSSFASHSIATAGALVLLCILSSKVSGEFSSLSISCNGATETCTQLFNFVKNFFLNELVLPLACYLFIFFAVTLLQTKGFFFFRFTRDKFGSTLSDDWHTVLLKCIFGVVLFFILSLLIPHRVTLLLKQAIHGKPLQAMLESVLHDIQRGCIIIAIIGVLAWVFSRFRFMHTHRMTRAEILEESRQ